MKRFMMICKTEFLLFVRDFSGFFFTFVFPVLMLLLFGSVYGNGPIYPGAAVGFIDVSVPAYCVMIMGVTGLMSFPLTLAEYKGKKIYKRFDATPAGKKSVMLAQAAVNIVMTLMGFLLLLLIGKFAYQIQILGDAVSVLVAILLSITTIFSMGFLFTAVGKDAKITNLLCNLSYFIMIFLSGATIPDMMFPKGVKMIAEFLPMTYAVDLMQGVFSGNALARHGRELLVLGSLSILFTAFGAVLYRKKDWT